MMFSYAYMEASSIKDVPVQGGGGYRNGDIGKWDTVNKDIPKTQNFFN